MLQHILFFLLGLGALVAGAEALVRGASRLALSWGITPLVVGLTIVAFGTSSPELAVSVGAALDGKTDIAVGNVVGSNIFNVLFILGISALIVPLTVHVQLIRQEVPIMIGAALILLALSLDGRISRPEATLLFALLLAYTAFLIIQSRRTAAAGDYEKELTKPSGWDRSPLVQVLLVVAGLALLMLGANWLVEAAIAFAKAMGVSDLVIGLTIVAAGTSMPEVATSIAAAIKGERDIAVGNVVGSSTFNVLGCLGLSGLVANDGLPIAPALLNFDMWVMFATALACLPIFVTGREIARWEGAIFVAYYLAYTAYLILAAQEHDALAAYSAIMLSFVVPITIVTVIAVMLRAEPGDGSVQHGNR
jgi:cation:H+ antiporter